MEKNTQKWSAVILVLFFVVSGCATKAETGAGIGALAGAAVGSQFGPADNRLQSAIIGAFIGTILGLAIGNEMDKRDRENLNQVLEEGQSDKITTWINPDTKNQYTVTPKPAYRGPKGRPCREARIDAVINGQHDTIVTNACRAEDGVWELQR